MQLSTRVATLPRAMRLLGAATLSVVLMCTTVFADKTIPDPVSIGSEKPKSVPEPSSTILLAFALGGLGLWSRGKWRASR